MNTTTETIAGRVVLLFCNGAGMLDLVILPLWVGGLIRTYSFDPQVAGGLVTLYLAGMVIANVSAGFLFHRLPARPVVTTGFLIAASCFFLMLKTDLGGGYSLALRLGALNLIGGLGAGVALAVAHGTMSLGHNPHRLFAVANLGPCIFAVLFFALTPPMMNTMGVGAVFVNAGAIILIAGVLSLFAFPSIPRNNSPKEVSERATGTPTAILILCFLGLLSMFLANSTILSFVERIGNAEGFESAAIGTGLMIGGIIPLLSPIAAGFLQNHLAATWTVVFGLLAHGAFAIVQSHPANFLVFTLANALITSTTVFTIIFAFGLLAKLDPSGRMNALTASMTMTGSALGPIYGGTIAKYAGFSAVGFGAAALAVIGALCFSVVAMRLRKGALVQYA
ncbi:MULTISPECIES: MFS transporter [Rhizobium/Agrobacterium group]|uniref:MFS transporter n=1 Tax=Rhizobium/Agrobacterium group TaxID=227290 RepID=UPI00107FA355|nr:MULTISPECIES: MFS transporter [Rhizobium/Agrobacterium group]MBB4403173.1 MFS family permease [Agrobacterium radiobacter]MBB5588917.1 MFS family permease [Agrobacterium radiobacter]TGE86512.1 hypothetical protein C9418_22565 [Rhizobium sp. SEMIA 4032]